MGPCPAQNRDQTAQRSHKTVTSKAVSMTIRRAQIHKSLRRPELKQLRGPTLRHGPASIQEGSRRKASALKIFPHKSPTTTTRSPDMERPRPTTEYSRFVILDKPPTNHNLA